MVIFIIKVSGAKINYNVMNESDNKCWIKCRMQWKGRVHWFC